MSEPLPLAAAAQRLRGRPRRPRRGPVGAQSLAGDRVKGGSAGGSQDSESGRPERPPTRLNQRRLLDVRGTAEYLSLGCDTIRELDASGVLSAARVKVPGGRGQDLRSVRFDRETLDRLVAGWRAPA
jgi:hypothetical protein